MLYEIVSVVTGIVVARILAPIPGVGSAVTIVICAAIGVNPLYGFIASIIVNSLKEGLIPCGNPYIDATPFTITNPKRLAWLKFAALCGGIAIGLGLSKIIGIVPQTGTVITIIIAFYIIFTTQIEWIQFALYIFGAFIIFSIPSSMPAVTVGICIFSIPSLIHYASSEEKEIDTTNQGRPDTLLLIIGTFISLFTPGVSSSALILTLGGDSRPGQLNTIAIAEPLIEGIGLSLLLFGVSKGKTIVSTLILYPSTMQIIACILVALVCCEIVKRTEIKIAKWSITAGIILNIVFLISVTGVLGGAAAAIIGYGCYKLSREMKREVGLTFLLPVI
jgi:hypothetical protein